jgi:hypothetical protein
MMRTILLAAVALALASCADVTSKQIVGDRPYHLDSATWDGAWLSASTGGVLYTTVKSAREGILEMGMVSSESGSLEIQKLDAHVRRAGKWLWISVDIGKEEGPKLVSRKPSGEYHFGLTTEPKDGHLIIWQANPAAFANAVELGWIKGAMIKTDRGENTGSISLDALHDGHLREIEQGAMLDSMDWKKPFFSGLKLKGTP